MDSSFPEEQQAFRDLVRCGADAEAPKTWMRAPDKAAPLARSS